MKRHFSYFLYVCRHKWYVFLACLRLKVPIWRAISHDLSKFSPTEWGPYARTFFNEDGSKADLRKNDSYDPNNQKLATEFTYAWIHHQRNPHHWQAWISIGDGGNLRVAKMPETYAREMIADWIGAGQAITGEKNPNKWYRENKDNILLHLQTRIFVEIELSELEATHGNS